MANDIFKGLLDKSSSPGSTWGELAGAYLSSGRKKDTRARNVLLATLFFNAKEASMQSKVLKNLEELEREKSFEIDKLSTQYEKQQKLLAENELYENSLYKDDLGQEHSTYFRKKSNDDFIARYGSIPQANTEGYGEYQKFVNAQEKGYIDRHKKQLQGLEDVKLRDVESKEEFLKPYNDYYEAKKKDLARPENISLVHKGFNMLFGKDDDKITSTMESAKTNFNTFKTQLSNLYKKDPISNTYTVDTVSLGRVKGDFPLSKFQTNVNSFVKTVNDGNYDEFQITLKDVDGKEADVKLFDTGVLKKIKVLETRNGKLVETGRDALSVLSTDINSIATYAFENQKPQNGIARSLQDYQADVINLLAEQGHLKIENQGNLFGDPTISYRRLSSDVLEDMRTQAIEASDLDILNSDINTEKELIVKNNQAMFESYISNQLKNAEEKLRISPADKVLQGQVTNLRNISTGDDQIKDKAELEFYINPPLKLAKDISTEELNTLYNLYQESYGRDKELEDSIYTKMRGESTRAMAGSYAQEFNLPELTEDNQEVTEAFNYPSNDELNNLSQAQLKQYNFEKARRETALLKLSKDEEKNILTVKEKQNLENRVFDAEQNINDLLENAGQYPLNEAIASMFEGDKKSQLQRTERMLQGRLDKQSYDTLEQKENIENQLKDIRAQIANI